MNREALRKLCDEATPKVLRKQRDVNRVNEGITLSGDTLVVQVWDGDSPETEAAWARFIAAARTAVPELLDELEAVEAWAEAHYKDGRCNLCGAPRENHEEMSPACRVFCLERILEGGER